MTILEKLWEGVSIAERRVRPDSAYGRLAKAAGAAQDEFRKELSESGKKALDRYETIESDVIEVSSCDAFIKGFRLGAQIIMASLGPIDSPVGEDMERLRA